MHGIGPTVQPHRRYRALRAAIENRFPVANAFLLASPGDAHGYSTTPGEAPREGPPQFSCSGGVGSSLQTFSSADDRTNRAGQAPRSLCHGHDRPGREARSSHHQPIRYEGFGSHACRARLGRTKGPARLPAAGNRCCEEDREVFPQTGHPGLGENLAHSTSLQAGQVTQRATRLLQSKMRRSQWREGK